MSIFIETLNVYRTVSKLLLKCSVFFCNSCTDFTYSFICPPYNINKKGLKLTVKVVKIKLKLNVFK